MKPLRQLPRLTADRLASAERDGKAEGWYRLCMKGYLPAEIEVHNGKYTRSDIRGRVRDYAASARLPVPASCAPIRARSSYEYPADWRQAFKATVMRIGLQLSLTQSMLEYLCAVSENTIWDRLGTSTNARPDNSLATAAALVKRGLIGRRTTETKQGRSARALHEHEWESHHELTEAGRIVVQLLKTVGVFTESDRAIERRHHKT